MNYFELINACLQELGYRKEEYFENLVKADHEVIKSLVNSVNIDICNSEDWWFKESKVSFAYEKGINSYKNNTSGKILAIYDGKTKLNFLNDYTRFFNQTAPSDCYSVFNDELLFSPRESTELEIYYSTSNSTIDESGEEKLFLEDHSDKSVIPAAYVRSLIVYGVCLKFKGNPKHPKFAFWSSEYIKALKGLKLNIRTEENSPFLRISPR